MNFQHPVGDGAVSYIPFSFLSLLLSRPVPYPRSAEEKALNQTAVASLRFLPMIVVEFVVIRMWLVSHHCFLPDWKSGAAMRNWPAEREGHRVVHILGYIQLEIPSPSVFSAATWCTILTCRRCSYRINVCHKLSHWNQLDCCYAAKMLVSSQDEQYSFKPERCMDFPVLLCSWNLKKKTQVCVCEWVNECALAC